MRILSVGVGQGFCDASGARLTEQGVGVVDDFLGTKSISRGRRMQENNAQARRSEFWSVLILSLGFGLVGIDRYLISTMFPAIARDLHLGYSDIGSIAGALSIAWGLAALLMGNAADRFGRRRVMVGSLVLFSLLIGASGLATGLAGLIAVRIVMGFADGAFTPASISATIACSPSVRHGRNVGIQQMTHILFGLGLAPLVVASLLPLISWRWIFVVFLLPGLLVAWLTNRLIADNSSELEAQSGAAAETGHGPVSLANWKVVLGISNIRILMVLMLCWLTCLITTSAFLPSYFVDHLRLGDVAMGKVMSAIGFGAAMGSLVMAWVSDWIGRKPVILIAAAGALLGLLGLNLVGPSPLVLFTMLFVVQFFNFAGLTLTVGPACAESVPAQLMATASGVVIACGELLGGGFAPMLAGHFAEIFGIEHLLYLPMAALALAFLLALRLKETLIKKDRAS
jgi:MFS family permease